MIVIFPDYTMYCKKKFIAKHRAKLKIERYKIRRYRKVKDKAKDTEIQIKPKIQKHEKLKHRLPKE